MQTLQFTRALRTIVTKLKTHEIVELLAPHLVVGTNNGIAAQIKDSFYSLLFDSRTGYTQLIDDPVTAKILQALQIDQIYESSRLGKLLSAFGQFQVSQNLWSSAQHYADFYTFWDQLVNVEKMEKALKDEGKNDRGYGRY